MVGAVVVEDVAVMVVVGTVEVVGIVMLAIDVVVGVVGAVQRFAQLRSWTRRCWPLLCWRA